VAAVVCNPGNGGALHSAFVARTGVDAEKPL
jgi:hypothetical protein